MIRNTTICLCVLVLALSSCGRRGNLEPPPDTVVETTDEQGNKVQKEREKQDKPFILDPLL